MNTRAKAHYTKLAKQAADYAAKRDQVTHMKSMLQEFKAEQSKQGN